MDAIDREILSALQSDGRMSMTELADSIRMSLSSCHRRVRELERSGLISGYRAIVDAGRVDLEFEALVFVTMAGADRTILAEFEAAVEDLDHILEAKRLFGDPDYLLRVVSRDLTSFQRYYDEHLSSLPGVHRLRSTLVMKTLVDDRPLPLVRART